MKGKEYKSSWAAICLAFCFCSLWNSQAQAQISGTVTDGTSGIADAKVEAWDSYPDGSVVDTTTTNAQGLFTLSNLSLGTYDVRAHRTGFFPQVKVNRTSPSANVNLALTSVPGITFTNFICDYWSNQNTTYSGSLIRSGDVITAKDPDGVVCGLTYTVEGWDGSYLFHIYGDDPTTPLVDEGAGEGDTITFLINNTIAQVVDSVIPWTAGGSFPVDLSASPSADFDFEVYPSEDTVCAGDSATYEIRVHPLYGFSSPCSLELTFLPSDSGITYTLNPDNLTPPDTSILKVYSTASSPLRIDTIIVTIRSNELIHEDKAYFSVVETPAIPQGLNVTPCCNRIVIQWDKVSFEKGYVLYQDTTILLDTLQADSNSYIYNNPPTGRHCYSVLAYNDCGESDTSDFVCDSVYLIKGNVRDINGDPLPDVFVYAKSISVKFSLTVQSKLNGPILDSTQTDALGNYRLLLPADTYMVFRDSTAPNGSYQIPLPPAVGDSVAGVNFMGYSDVEDPPEQNNSPSDFILFQNYPNPFNSATRIEYLLKNPSLVALEIFDIVGTKVATLIQGKQPEGIHSLVWDVKDSQGREVSSGIYFCRLKTGEFQKVKRMIYIK